MFIFFECGSPPLHGQFDHNDRDIKMMIKHLKCRQLPFFKSKRLLDPKSTGRKPILFLLFSFNQEQMQSKQCTLEKKSLQTLNTKNLINNGRALYPDTREQADWSL